MLGIEKYRKQVERLNECVNNLQSSITLLASRRANRLFYSVSEIQASEFQVRQCYDSLIGQLKLMNMQNEEELK